MVGNFSSPNLNSLPNRCLHLSCSTRLPHRLISRVSFLSAGLDNCPTLGGAVPRTNLVLPCVPKGVQPPDGMELLTACLTPGTRNPAQERVFTPKVALQPSCHRSKRSGEQSEEDSVMLRDDGNRTTFFKRLLPKASFS